MIDLGLLKRLIETVEASGIDTLEISRWGTRIRISKSPPGLATEGVISAQSRLASADREAGADDETNAGAASDAGSNASGAAVDAEAGAAEAAKEYAEVVSPMVGTFYRAPAPDAPPYVDVGDHVTKGQTLCILEAMKLMNELESEVDGTITEICVGNAEPVEYGQVLFHVRPD